MKCIKMGEDMKKVSDQEASKAVGKGEAKYIPKSVYKEAKGKGAATTSIVAGSKSSSKKAMKKAKKSNPSDMT